MGTGDTRSEIAVRSSAGWRNEGRAKRHCSSSNSDEVSPAFPRQTQSNDAFRNVTTTTRSRFPLPSPSERNVKTVRSPRQLSVRAFRGKTVYLHRGGSVGCGRSGPRERARAHAYAHTVRPAAPTSLAHAPTATATNESVPNSREHASRSLFRRARL